MADQDRTEQPDATGSTGSTGSLVSTEGADRPVVLSGASGLIGTYLRQTDGGLPARGWSLRLVGHSPVEPLDGEPDLPSFVADVGEEDSRDALDEAFAGADAVVHMAGIPGEDSWTSIRRTNIDGTYRVLEAARRAGVRRVVLASSNHAVGFLPTGETARTDVSPRPDTYYGVSKAAMEALGSLYADKYGVEVVSLRIGMCNDKPASTFDLGIWLSPADTVRLVDAALRGPVDGPVIAYGVSANTRGWWDLSSARALGYDPQDDAEVYADEVEPYDGPEGVLGHGFVALDPHDD